MPKLSRNAIRESVSSVVEAVVGELMEEEYDVENRAISRIHELLLEEFMALTESGEQSFFAFTYDDMIDTLDAVASIVSYCKAAGYIEAGEAAELSREGTHWGVPAAIAFYSLSALINAKVTEACERQGIMI